MTDYPSPPSEPESEEESNLVSYGRSELQSAGLFGEDADYGGMLGDAVLAIVKLFAQQGHSGMSAGMTIAILEKLLRYQPLTPLTYAADEWVDHGETSGGPLWQNKRQSDVFSNDNGVTWYCLDGTSGVRGEESSRV